MPNNCAAVTWSVSIFSFLKVSNSAHASAMPSSTALRISGLSLSASKSPSGPMPMEANRSRISFSSGSTGANRIAKPRISKNCGEVFCWSGVSGGTKSIAGAGAGGGWLRNTDSGVTW